MFAKVQNLEYESRVCDDEICRQDDDGGEKTTPYGANFQHTYQRDSGYPKKENTSPKNQIMMKFSASASPLPKSASFGGVYQKSETYDFVR